MLELSQTSIVRQKSYRDAILTAMSKLALFSELWAFLRIRKKWWLAPILGMLILLGALIVLSQTSALAPLIYTLF